MKLSIKQRIALRWSLLSRDVRGTILIVLVCLSGSGGLFDAVAFTQERISTTVFICILIPVVYCVIIGMRLGIRLIMDREETVRGVDRS